MLLEQNSVLMHCQSMLYSAYSVIVTFFSSFIGSLSCTVIQALVIQYLLSDATVYFNPEMIRAPSTKEEVVELVKFAAENERRIRVLGSGHSWSAVARSDDLLLSLHLLTGLVAVDPEAKQVTVRAGTTLRELNTLLDNRGLALKNNPSISDQTIAGVISTGKFSKAQYTTVKST